MFIKERLDRGVTNMEWWTCFPEAVVAVEAAVSSDHALLVLRLKKKKMVGRLNGVVIFVMKLDGLEKMGTRM